MPFGQKPWTQDEEKRLIELKQKGLTYRQISKQMNRSYWSVKHKYHAMKKSGFKPKKTKPSAFPRTTILARSTKTKPSLPIGITFSKKGSKKEMGFSLNFSRLLDLFRKTKKPDYPYSEKEWSLEEVDKYEELKQKGLEEADIAKILGRSVQSVRRMEGILKRK